MNKESVLNIIGKFNESMSKKLITKLGDKTDILSKQDARVLLYTHFDLDGLGSIILLKQFPNIDLRYIVCPLNANECIKDSILWENYDLVLITDLSVSEEVADKIDEYIKYGKDNVRLLDHHESATYLNNREWACVIPQCKDINLVSSGTLLTYLYLIKPSSILYNLTISEFARLVSFYDTYFFKSEEGKLIYPDAEPEDLNLLVQSTTQSGFINKMINNISRDFLYTEEDKIVINTLRNVINNTCSRYYNNTRFIKIDGKIAAFCYCSTYISQVSAFIYEKCPEVDYVITVNMNRESISIRTKKDINLVTYIATPNNGGGHPDACGYSIKDIGIQTLLNSILHTLPGHEAAKIGKYNLGDLKKMHNDCMNQETHYFNLGEYLDKYFDNEVH